MRVHYGLRHLFIATALAAIAAALWLRPYAVEVRRADGSLQARFELRRDWRGNEIAHGQQVWYDRGGDVFLTKSLHGQKRTEAVDEWLDIDPPPGQWSFNRLMWLILETTEPSTSELTLITDP
jgi:hypothetical protein